MSESDLKMLAAEFERLRRDCNTPEKAIAQLKLEGLLDAEGHLPEKYRNDMDVWQ